MIAAVGGGPTLVTGLGSNPGFVTPTTIWYAGQAACPPSDQCGADLTGLDGTVHACDVTSSRDQVVVYRTGEELIKNGSHCCGPRRSR